MHYAIGKDKTLQTFFAQKWLRPYFATDIAARKHKPGYDTAANRRTLNALVMDALGSNLNPKDFILCEGSINTMKEHLWGTKDPMRERLYQIAVNDAMNGAVPSSDYLSALRTVLFPCSSTLDSVSSALLTIQDHCGVRLLELPRSRYQDTKHQRKRQVGTTKRCSTHQITKCQVGGAVGSVSGRQVRHNGDERSQVDRGTSKDRHRQATDSHH